jgi:hypothetical protein
LRRQRRPQDTNTVHRYSRYSTAAAITTTDPDAKPIRATSFYGPHPPTILPSCRPTVHPNKRNGKQTRLFVVVHPSCAVDCRASSVINIDASLDQHIACCRSRSRHRRRAIATTTTTWRLDETTNDNDFDDHIHKFDEITC